MTNDSFARIEAALRSLRPSAMPEEAGLHAEVARVLRDAGIPFRHEHRLGPRCRADFMIDGIVLEVKKGKPQPTPLKRQLARYLAFEEAEGILVVLQRSVSLPGTIAGKPVRQFCLDRNWGVSLP